MLRIRVPPKANPKNIRRTFLAFQLVMATCRST